MPTKHRNESALKAGAAITETVLSNPNIGESGDLGPATTGRYIIIFKDEVEGSKVKSTLDNVAGLKNVMYSSDYVGGAIAADDVAKSDAVHFIKLGIAVVSDSEAFQRLSASASGTDSPIL